MKKLIIGLLLIGLFSCAENKVSEFSLSGKTNGIENGTILYLLNPDKNEDVDSTVVNDDSFVFKTKLAESPMHFYLHNKDYSKYTTFWVENTEMQFDASKTDFRNATIIGSKTEEISRSLSRVIDSVSRNERPRLEKNFARESPNSIVSARMLNIYSTTWGKELTKELFDNFSIENQNSKYGKEIAKYIELNKNPQIGDNYVDFEMADRNGVKQKLSDNTGKIVLLEFWASWCGPCRQENPNLIKTYDKFAEKGFEIFAVSLDDKKDNWLKAIEKDNLKWQHVSDLNGRRNKAGLIYGVNGIPDNVLIDQSGTIVGRNLRGEELNEKLSELTK